MSGPQDRRNLLRNESSDLSDSSIAVAPPQTPGLQQRHRHRTKTTREELIPSLSELEQEENQLSYSGEPQGPNRGLGIRGANLPTSVGRKPVSPQGSPRMPNATSAAQLTPSTNPILKSPNTPEIPTPGSSKPFLSPPWQGYQPADRTRGDDKGGGMSTLRDYDGRLGHDRTVSFPDEPVERYVAGDDIAQSTLYKGPSISGCTTKRDISTGSGSYLSRTLLMLSFYSTTMSMLWIIVASMQPRWGKSIYTGGALAPSTASLLSALFAKTIELSFVTVFVGFLGQVLSRKSIYKYSKGITIAEMTMRTWVIQPGFMITHWQTLRYVGWTFLGILSFIAALGAMFFTTASDALVSPKLKFGGWTNINMQGLVRTSYANPQFVSASCQTPITVVEDGQNAELTCLSIEHAGQSYYNFLSWMQTWAGINQNGTGESTNILERPQAVAMLFDNTTVQGSWVMANSSNMTMNYDRFARVVNNVTMSMPHAGVFAAARDPKNQIMQPDELDGVGGYSIKASVPSPAVNVLCVNMARDELAPLVYTEWPNARLINSSIIPGQMIPWDVEQWINQIPTAGSNETWLNSTVVDEVFQWGEKYTRRPPVFPMFPIDFNTIMNTSMYRGDSVYFIAKSPNTVNYTLCSLRSFLHPNCSTQHDVSGTSGGSSLKSLCEDPNDKEAYALSVPNSPISLSTDWVNIAIVWALSLSLNDGTFNANSSTARLLSLLVATEPNFPTLQPSLSEALAVLVGSTLLLSTTSAAFVHYWQYQGTILTPGEYQNFNASVSTQQFTSGYAQTWQAAFYPILAVVALINIFCFVHYFFHAGLLTDYTEPQNLFALAINSPPSESLEGSCGAGPERSQFQTGWIIKEDTETNHWYIQESNEWKMKTKIRMKGKTSGYEFLPNASSLNNNVHSRTSSYTKLSNTWSFL